MSTWLFGRKKNGRRAIYSIGIPWPMLLFWAVLLAAIVVPILYGGL